MLVEKPLMSMKHDDVAFHLGYLLQRRLDRSLYRVNVNGGKTRHSARHYSIPDVVVIPAALVLPFADDPQAFNAFAEPLPLVVEISFRTTGDGRHRGEAAWLSRARRRRNLVHPPL